MSARTGERRAQDLTGSVAIPGYQFWLIIFGGEFSAWASFGLMTE